MAHQLPNAVNAAVNVLGTSGLLSARPAGQSRSREAAPDPVAAPPAAAELGGGLAGVRQTAAPVNSAALPDDSASTGTQVSLAPAPAAEAGSAGQLPALDTGAGTALNAALGQTELLQQQVQRSGLLSSESIKDTVVASVQSTAAGQGSAGASTAAHGQQSIADITSRMLLEGAKLQHAEVHAQQLAAIAEDTAALHISAAVLDKDEDKLRSRFVRRRFSLAAAIQEDAALEGLSDGDYGSGSESGGDSEEDDYDGDSEYEEEADKADYDEAAYSTGAQPPAAAAAADHQTFVIQGLPAMLRHMSVQRQRGQRSSLQLSDVAAAVWAGLPQQQEQLASIRRRAAITSTRLRWQVVRPRTYAGDLALTAHQRSIKGLAQGIIDELLNAALAHIAMRPTKQQVLVEVAEWKAARPAALAGISRHTADSIYKEVVEELLAEVAVEAAQAAAAADVFSFDMLVAAVAFSQGKYDLGFNAGVTKQGLSPRPSGSTHVDTADASQADTGQSSARTDGAGAAGSIAFGRARGSSVVGGIAREAALLQKAAEIEAEAAAEAAAAAQQRGAPRLVIAAGDAQLDMAEEDVYLARRDFAAADHAFAVQQAASDGAGGGQGAGGRQQQLVPARALYLAGLQGMLWEMRKRVPPDTPYGHTQPLAPHFAGTAVSKARRIAVTRQRPPLAASAAVWARREAPTGRLEQGTWPTAAHLAAAVREREFWGKVALRPRMQRPPLPGPACLEATSLVVPEALGAVTALSGCPAGTFVAAGTSRGALLVWDLRKDAAVAPWFQVTGTGQLYKRRWWNPWAAKPPRRPAIAGFAWSSDSYQLAALDASSNLKMWWMRPEERQDGQSVAELQARAAAVTPELAVLITPFMVALSGKAPVAEEGDAASTARLPAAEGSGSSTTFTQKLGQWLGLLHGEGPGGVRALPPRQWRPVLHPAFTIAGTQPTVVIPQVTGDVLSLTTDISGPVLPGFGPTVFAERANAATGLAAATAVAGLGRAGRAHGGASGGAVDAAGTFMPQAVVDFLMPPQAINADIVSQSLYRGHSSHVVFLGFLSDASLISLDAAGCLAQWPPSAADRCGFGWLAPRKRWQLPRATRTCQPRGDLQPVWPALPGRAGRTGGRKSKKAAAGPGSAWVPEYCPDAQDRADAALLQQDPTGAFLLQPRLPWLVRYLPAGSSGSGSSSGRVLRQVLHRPLDNSQAGSNMLVISSFDAASGELLMRAKQRCTFVRAGMKVVSAELTASKRELLIFCLVAPHQEDPAAGHAFAVSVINLASMRQLVPRIDVHDPSEGTAAPAYALTPALNTTGSDYLLMNLGCGVAGAFSLATGQLVREIASGLQEPKLQRPGGCYFCALALLRVGEKHGRCSNAGRTFLCCAAAGGQAVYVLELGLEEAAQQAQEQRDQRGRNAQPQRQQQQMRQQQQQQQQEEAGGGKERRRLMALRP
ncbi:hypothetical protein COO60DRAFT_1700968 [Scenedesmus sp. NREL 46B-D3]|nr:hypothetical protein COO60DRAFT_1700968 [Scenedesmus sp. NREL 46B-D3]